MITHRIWCPPRVWVISGLTVQSALVIRTMFVPLCFSERNVLITSSTYECSYSQRNYLVFWKSVPMADVLIARVSYDVLITRVDCRCFGSVFGNNEYEEEKVWLTTHLVR